MQPLLTPEEVAAYLRVGQDIVDQAIKEGLLPAYMIGDQYRTTWHDVQTYLRAIATVPASDDAAALSANRSQISYSSLASVGGKYWRIGELLATRHEPSVAYRFADLERQIGVDLPDSARHHRAWWSNTLTSHPHARSWLSQGWRVARVDLTNEEVTFEHTGRR